MLHYVAITSEYMTFIYITCTHVDKLPKDLIDLTKILHIMNHNTLNQIETLMIHEFKPQ